MARSDRRDEERDRHREFAVNDSDPDYRRPLKEFDALWSDFNGAFCGSRLRPTHFAIGRTAPRQLGRCTQTTDYGGSVQTTINERLVFLAFPAGPSSSTIIRPWPARGTVRFFADLIRRFAARQVVMEMRGAVERAHGGYGRRFAEEANRIGALLPDTRADWEVTDRNRAGQQKRLPLAKFWPHVVRPEGYYGDDVSQELLDLACGTNHAARRLPAPPSLGLLELVMYRLSANQPERAVARARELLARHIDRLQVARGARLPLYRRVEAGLEDIDKLPGRGSPLGTVLFDPAWSIWNNGIVRKVADSIHEWRAFGELPILADALEDAGCDDDRILRHLRARIEHTRNCWVLRGLREVGESREAGATWGLEDRVG